MLIIISHTIVEAENKLRFTFLTHATMSTSSDIPNNEEAFNIRVGYVRSETKEIARNELREIEEIKASAIKELRQLLADSDDLHYRNDDEFLLIFLRACHFYPSSALEKVRSYCMD